MPSEKEMLVEFVFVLMNELGRDDLMKSTAQKDWLKFPLSGIRQAANDMVEMSQDLAGKELEILDAKLNSLSLPSLSNMREKGYRELLKILSRNKIKNSDEWYLIKSYLNSSVLNEELRLKAMEITDAFEHNGT